MSKFIEHDEQTVLALAIFLAIHDDKTWASISEQEQAVYRLMALDLLDYLFILNVKKVESEL